MVKIAKKYAFALGREQEICLEELKSVLTRFGFYFDIYRISGNIVFANTEKFTREDARAIVDILGGTIKIYELVDSLGNNLTKQIADLIKQEMNETEEILHQVPDDFSSILKKGQPLRSGKINFGISCYNKRFSRQQLNSFALGAKKKFKGELSLRFVESKDGLMLSSIQTLKNNLAGKGIEFGIFDEEIGILVGLNNPEEWNKRDYDKPAFDKYSGMVPPKLARMMVNLALDQGRGTRAEGQDEDSGLMTWDLGPKTHDLKPNTCVVVDPFCGSGNILMEAVMLGCDIIGSDVSDKAVRDSKANVEWLLTQGQGPSSKGQEFEIFEADASSEEYLQKLSTLSFEPLASNKNIIFVTEPFLGEPKKFKTSFRATVGEYEKIYKLYIAFLKNCLQLTTYNLQPTLCLIFPLLETVDQGQFSLYKECVDEIKKLGYTQVRTTMVYGRDYQVVKREIVMLKLV